MPEETIAHLLQKSRRLLFITGAGISVDSGLPTYRGVGGLYDEQGTEDGVRIEEALSIGMLRRRPEITWKYLWQIGEACRGAKPNRAHEVIAELEKEKEEVLVITQNVDGLHRDAGSQNLVEVHGNMETLRCTRCEYQHKVEELVAPEGDRSPPTCPNCAAILRPDVVLFGEILSDDTLARLFGLNVKRYDMVFSIGTSAVFPYITRPVYEAVQAGIPTVEINPGESEISGLVDFHVKEGAAKAMGELWGER